MYTSKPQVLKDFAADERGAVAMLFGLMLTALLFLAGMAVDYTRAVDVRTRVSDAADSAALAAGRALMEGSLSVAEIKDLATKYFNENIKSLKGQATFDTPNVTVDPKTGGVTINVESHVKMTLARLMGKTSMDFPITSVANFSQKDIEVGMALDITGSMRDPAFDGQTKINGLKKAFQAFATRLIPDSSNSAQKVRIAIAPYAHTVNLGSYVNDVTTKPANSCVTERKSGTYSDETGEFFQLGKSGSCIGNESKVVPLSDDRDGLIKTVNAFQTYNSTAGHLGVQWAWNLVSPTWGSTWGSGSAPDSLERVQEGKLIKAVVLMTDGIFNTQYHGPQSKKQAIELCNAMKAEGIVVFSVAFSGPREAADTDTLKSCATSGQGYFANASSAEELETAFNNFASKLTELRIAK